VVAVSGARLVATVSTGTFGWDLGLMADGLRVPKAALAEAFSGDARVAAPFLEVRAAQELKGRQVGREENGWDVVAGDGSRWEVRAAKHTVYLSPSSARGMGRSFDAGVFLEKLRLLTGGYFVVAAGTFPGETRWWGVPTALVRWWWHRGHLGTKADVGMKKFVALVDSENPIYSQELLWGAAE
jgi:hypothetical protein